MPKKSEKAKREAELLAHYLQIIADKRTPARTRVLAGYAVMWLDGKITKPEFLALNRRANERPTTTASTDKRLTKIREAAEDENRDGEENDGADSAASSPSEKPSRLQRDEMIAEAIANGKQPQLGILMAQYDAKQKTKCEPVYYRARWPPRT